MTPGHEPRRLGRPRQIDRASIVSATLQPPDAGLDRWSCRELSARLGVSEATVARIWREYGIAPKAHSEYAFTVQPELSATHVGVIGVCLTRRVRAVALLVDDPNPARQVPPAPRNLDPAAKVGVRDFLRRLTESYPERTVHVVVDTAHLQRLLLQSVPQLTSAGVVVHFALDTEKGLNMVDVWAEMMLRDGLAGALHPAVRARELLSNGRTVIWTESDGDVEAAEGDGVEAGSRG